MGLKKINIDRPDSNAIDNKNRRIDYATLLFYLKERFYLENISRRICHARNERYIQD